MIFDWQIAFWGEENQEKLANATIFVAGIGGIGCLLAELLVRAGVGKIYLSDNGIVDAPDLNRQLFYRTKDIGARKIDVALSRLQKVHGKTEIEAMGSDLLLPSFSFPADVDGVADCLDNFSTRFAFWRKIPEGTFYVHGGVEQFFGQVLTLIVGETPTLEDVFGNCDSPRRIIPVTGTSSSTVGALAATEVINNIFGKPKLVRTMLVVDLSDFTFDKIRL